MVEIIRIGIDTSKSVFQVHGVDDGERPVLLKRLRRAEVERFFAAMAPTMIGMEACGGAHHWGRVLQRLGPEGPLLPPPYLEPYLKRRDNGWGGAEADCDAVRRASIPR